MRDLTDFYGKTVNVRGYANDCIRNTENNAYILVTNVLVTFRDITKKIDHIWTNAEHVDSHAVNFDAKVTIYQRRDGSCDYGFKNEINMFSY